MKDNELITRRNIELALLNKGQHSRRYRLGDIWELNYDEIREVLDGVDADVQSVRWIPCSERLPKNHEWVLGIFQEGDTGWINPIPFVCDYIGKKTPITTQDNWLLKMVDEPHHPYYEKLRCIAWMPCPLWKEDEAE